jgi:hypothetical protein
MKLTKGKLSKIRNKKNQSAKRFKKTGKGSKTKTFRKRRALNLHNTSLKKYKGGQESKSTEKDSKVNESTKPDEALTTTDVVVPPTTDVVGATDVVVPPTTDVVGATDVVETPTTNVVGATDVVETPTTNVVDEPAEEIIPPPDSGEGPGIVSEVGSDVSSLAKEEMGEDSSAAPDATPVSENESDAASEIVSEDADAIKEEPVAEEIEPSAEPSQQQQTVGNDISIVAESLDKLAEYISDKIAKKLSLGTSAAAADLNRDSFNAVANANEALVQA